MNEWDVIKKTKAPNTINSLSKDFCKIGLKEGDTVLVHSSLSSIGWVCGEEVAVIEALIRAVGLEGTICMPAHSGGNSDPAQWENPPVPKEWCDIIYRNMPAFDPLITPTRGIGRIAEEFRRYPETIRSDHPQTSFSARGRFAEEIVRNHSLTPQFGWESPLGRLYRLGAKVLLLGVGYDSCTSFHMAEVLCGKTPTQKLGAAVLSKLNIREWIWFEDYAYNCDDFPMIGSEFEKECEVSLGTVGNADCRLFDLKSGVDFAVRWLKENRAG